MPHIKIHFPVLNYLLICLFFTIHSLSAQQIQQPQPAQKSEIKQASTDYISVYNKGDYNETLKVISEKLASAYNARTDTQKIPDDYIFIKKEEDRKNITFLFMNRKADRFFIEDNPELSGLHLYAARSYFKTGNGEAALNHYFTSLRYKTLDYQKDDVIFYEISQVYKSINFYEAYTRSLETAYSLNPTKFEYSLELGRALGVTKNKKKAVFHLKRYIESRGDDIPDIILFLTLGNLYEDIGEYMETAKNYKKYLDKKNDDGYVNFALGYLAFNRTGDHKLALDCLEKSIKYLPEKELFRRSKAAEYQADIYMQDLEYDKAIQFYLETKKYHDKIQLDIKENNDKISKKNEEIRDAKYAIKAEKLYERYDKYQKLNVEKGSLEFANREMNYELGKINAGKIRWNIALCYERIDKPEDAIQYYNESVSLDYNSNEARDRIKKLKLKIKRGY
jgi:tetratricopeptide (TPR) repeat protein